MNYLPEEDTIVALSSPLGNGAIAVIRVSGKQALSAVNPLLKAPLTEADARKARFNQLRSAAHELIDQVVTTYFMAPASYSGEDIIEISCHCNPLIIQRIIDQIVRCGARIAEPGEFTFRAFMNGKLNLSQAEAVAEIINARSRQSLAQSVRHLEGRLSDRIKQIQTEILNYLSLLEINLDFSDEEVEVMPMTALKEKIGRTRNQITELLKTFDYGRLLQEGIKLLILGKPNVGKSSLLNVLLARDRSIVSDIPGTTRDYIEANLELDGLAVQAVDTAGIRKTEDAIESIGIARTLTQLETADIALCLFDSHKPLDEDDAVLKDIIGEAAQSVKLVSILNKTDLGEDSSTQRSIEALGYPVSKISAVTSSGIAELKKIIKEQLIDDLSMESEEVVVTSARHKSALEKTIDSLNLAEEAIDLKASEEVIAVDIRLALDHLGEITGETTPEDVLNHIFANFCIGK